MALDTRAEALGPELDAANRMRESHLRSLPGMIQQYAGSVHSDPDAAAPDNPIYEYITLMAPKLIYENPRFVTKTARPGSQREVARAIGMGLNRWAKQGRFCRVGKKLAIDFLFAHFVCIIHREPAPGHRRTPDDDPQWPTVTRIDPQRFVFDPIAEDLADARWMGHHFYRDQDDIEKEPESEGWIKDAIESLADNRRNDKVSTRNLYGQTMTDESARKEVRLCEIWVPEHELEDSPGPDFGYHGTIFTFAAQGETDGGYIQVRKPRPYYGPPGGPYVVSGAHIVPSDPFPMSPLQAIDGHTRNLVNQAEFIAETAKRYKRMILVDSADPEIIAKVKAGEHDLVVPVAGAFPQGSGGVVPLEIGGLTEQMLAYMRIVREQWDRASGMHEVQRGNVESDTTATAVAVANDASETRVSGIKDGYAEGVAEIANRVAWYLYHDDDIQFPLGEEAAEELGMVEPWFQGGDFEDRSGATFNDLELEIEPLSMERVSEGMVQRRTLEGIQLIGSLVPVMVQAPFVRWPEVIGSLGEALNMPDLGDWVDMKMLKQASQAQYNPQRSTPMLGRQVGRTPPQVRQEPQGGGGAMPGQPQLQGNITGQNLAVPA